MRAVLDAISLWAIPVLLVVDSARWHHPAGEGL